MVMVLVRVMMMMMMMMGYDGDLGIVDDGHADVHVGIDDYHPADGGGDGGDAIKLKHKGGFQVEEEGDVEGIDDDADDGGAHRSSGPPDADVLWCGRVDNGCHHVRVDGDEGLAMS